VFIQAVVRVDNTHLVELFLGRLLSWPFDAQALIWRWLRNDVDYENKAASISLDFGFPFLSNLSLSFFLSFSPILSTYSEHGRLLDELLYRYFAKYCNLLHQ
jgi:hypothetical protein